jgi:hypothetical protein
VAVASWRMSDRVLRMRCSFVPGAWPKTGFPSTSTSMAGTWLKRKAGGSFFTGTDAPLCWAPITLRDSSRRSRDMVDGPPVTACWMAAPYFEASAGALGKVDFTTWIPWKATDRAVRSTRVTPWSSTTPKMASLVPSGRTETAAWAWMA